MQSRLMALPIRMKVLPKDGIPCNRLERNTCIIRLVTINEIAPLLVVRRLQSWKVRAAAGTICLNVDEESRFDIAVEIWSVGEPIVVISVLV